MFDRQLFRVCKIKYCSAGFQRTVACQLSENGYLSAFREQLPADF